MHGKVREIYHKFPSSCIEIIRKKVANFPVSGFVCRNCREYFPLIAPKKAMIAKRKGFRKIPCRKIPEMAALMEPPKFCRKCSRKLWLAVIPDRQKNKKRSTVDSSTVGFFY